MLTAVARASTANALRWSMAELIQACRTSVVNGRGAKAPSHSSGGIPQVRSNRFGLAASIETFRQILHGIISFAREFRECNL
jgi:hypothetical protein